jgi:hypothetical protein
MKRRGLLDRHGDPMESMGNLFDITILIAVGFLVFALSGLGLNDILLDQNMTIVKNPGEANMELIRRKNGKIERLRQTGATAQGAGIPVGTVYRLDDGRMIWVPGTPGTSAAPAGGTPVPSAGATGTAAPGTIPSTAATATP